jgi:hypothetical protein
MDVHEHDPRMQPAGHLNGFIPIARFADQFKIAVWAQQTADRPSKNRVVIDQ